jgi:hypothetical protein
VDLELDTRQMSVEDCLDKVLTLMQNKGILGQR